MKKISPFNLFIAIIALAMSLLSFFRISTLAKPPHPKIIVQAPSKNAICSEEKEKQQVVSLNEKASLSHKNCSDHKLKEKLDINKATQKEWMTLSGIGPKLSEEIIKTRNERGAFTSLDDLLSVQGIGPKKLSKWRPFLTGEKKESPEKKVKAEGIKIENWQEKPFQSCPSCKGPLSYGNGRYGYLPPYCKKCLKYLGKKEDRK